MRLSSVKISVMPMGVSELPCEARGDARMEDNALAVFPVAR